MIAAPVSPVDRDVGPESEPSGPLGGLVGVVRKTGRPCVICARIPLDRQDVKYLLSLPEVVSVIIISEDRELLEAFPDRLGYYTNGSGDWRLPARMSRELLYVGSWAEFGARAALSAWRAGVRGIRIVSGFEPNRRRRLFAVAVQKSLKSLFYRIRQPSLRIVQDTLRNNPGLAFQVEQFQYGRRVRQIGQLPVPVPGAPSSWRRGRIVVVSASLGPGGAERQLSATLLGLVAHGYRDVHFLHYWPMKKPNDFYLPLLTEAGIPYSQVSRGGLCDEPGAEFADGLMRRLKPLGELGVEASAYVKEFLARRPEIVHVWQDHMNVVAGLAALLAGVPRIYLSCRSLSPTHFAFNQPYMRPVYRLLARFPNVTLLNNSGAGAMDYSRWLDVQPARIHVIRNGFDFASLPSPEKLAELRVEYRSRLGIPPDAPVVGAIMRISEEKRPLLWMQIAQHVARRLPQAHFLVVGDGPMRESIEAFARKALPGRTHFPGHERNAAMAIAAMDMFLLTSRAEGLPNVLIEAQAIGVPPVALDVGGVREALCHEKTGWLIASASPEAAADTIVSLLSNNVVLGVASRRGRKFVQEQFSQEKMIRETLVAYGYKDSI